MFSTERLFINVSVATSIIDEKVTLICTIKGLTAKGKRTPNGFLVLKGSQAILQHRPSSKWSKKRREELIGQGILVKEDTYYVFSKDVEFTSPSTAGAMVCGGATNGLVAWKTSEGKTLKELEQEIKI